MILDKLAILEDKLALSTLLVATTQTTYSYDTGAAGVPAAIGLGGPIGGGYATVAASATQAPTTSGQRLHDVGRGRSVGYVAQIGTATTSGGAATLEEDIVESDLAALTGNYSNTLVQSPAVALAALVSGYRFPVRHLPGRIARRYVGGQHVVGTAVFTAGTISCALVFNADDNADIIGGVP